MNRFPYPVLNQLDSGYKKNCLFSIDADDCKGTSDFFVINVNLKLVCKSINMLIQNGMAKIVFKITSNSVSKVYTYKTLQPMYELKYPTEDLLDIDKVQIIAYILAAKEFTMKYCDEIEEYFGDTFEFDAKLNVKLAVSNELRFNYSLTNSNVIKLTTKSDNDGKGISYSCSDPNYIRIYVGNEINDAYARIKSNIVKRDLVNAMLVSNAISYTLFQLIKDGVEPYKEYKWFKILSQDPTFDNKSLEEYINEMRSSTDSIDVDTMFDLVQQLINNNMETSIIESSKEMEN